MDVWLDALKTVFPPIAKLGVLIVIGAGLAWVKLLDERRIGWVTRAVVWVLLPALLLGKILKQFRPGEAAYTGWYWLPLLAVAMLGLGYSLGWLAHRLFAHDASAPGRRIVFASLCGWQNAGYVPIPIIAALYGWDSEMLVYCFLFILGFSPTMWSLGPLNMARAGHGAEGSVDWRKLITPPFVANVSGIALCLVGVPQYVESAYGAEMFHRALTPLVWLGYLCIPVIMILLGAMLASRRSGDAVGARFALGLIGVKLLLVPAVMALVILAVRANWQVNAGFLALFFIEATAPPATGLSVIARRYGGPEQSRLVNQGILWSYLAAVVTLPAWLMVGHALFGLFPR